MKKIIIAIDGFSSTGKSTIAKQLASYLNYIYVDTGAMYRAVAYYAMHENLISATNFDKEGIIRALPKIDLEFRQISGEKTARIFLNGKDVEDSIRNLVVSNYVSQIAAIHEVRLKLVSQQKKMGINKGIVMDGRDIGTVVFPEAELKIFMTASPEIRAERRYRELLNKGENIHFDQVLENIKSRDHIDTTRADSPLKKAPDALEFDNSEMNTEEQFAKIVALAENRIREKSE